MNLSEVIAKVLPKNWKIYDICISDGFGDEPPKLENLFKTYSQNQRKPHFLENLH